MSTIQELYQQSLLAQAAYANFAAYPGDTKGALVNAGMTTTQAATLGKRGQARFILIA